MPFKRTTNWWVGAAAVLATSLIRGQVMSEQYVMQVPDFRAGDLSSVDSGADKLLRSYRSLTDDLVKQLRDANLPTERKVYVIYLLGQLRAVSAVAALIDRIDLKAPKVESDAIGRWGLYPSQEALVRIGTPAVNAVIDKLPTEGNELRRQLMCAVISDSLGNRVADAMVRFRYEEERDPSRRANLEAAVRLLERR
jgi:hypothetical protein